MDATMPATPLTKEQWLEIEKRLKTPFKPERVKYRVQGKAGAKGKTQVLAYIDARDVMDRLDQAVGQGNWSFELRPVPGLASGMIGALTIYGVTKMDMGDAGDIEKEKSMASGALKRAAVQWGVARYLYGLGRQYADCQGSSFIPDAELKRLQSRLPKPDVDLSTLPDFEVPDEDEGADGGTQSVSEQQRQDPRPQASAAGEPAATENQLTSIRKLCVALGKPEPTTAFTLEGAKQYIAQLAAEFNAGGHAQPDATPAAAKPASSKAAAPASTAPAGTSEPMGRREFLAETQAMGLTPPQVMERLGVRTLDGLNLREALGQLRRQVNGGAGPQGKPAPAAPQAAKPSPAKSAQPADEAATPEQREQVMKLLGKTGPVTVRVGGKDKAFPAPNPAEFAPWVAAQVGAHGNIRTSEWIKGSVPGKPAMTRAQADDIIAKHADYAQRFMIEKHNVANNGEGEDPDGKPGQKLIGEARQSLVTLAELYTYVATIGPDGKFARDEGGALVKAPDALAVQAAIQAHLKAAVEWPGLNEATNHQVLEMQDEVDRLIRLYAESTEPDVKTALAEYYAKAQADATEALKAS